jgi:hypothetical protein
MRDLTNSLRRQVRLITRKVKIDRPRQISLDRLLRIFAGNAEPTPEEQGYLIDYHRQHELNYGPPDQIDRLLARKMAELTGEPDPYGTDGMSESERRARDWGDYHEKERLRRKEFVQEEVRLPIDLHELRPPEAIPMY